MDLEARPKDFKAFWSRPGFILLILFVYFYLFLFISSIFIDFNWFPRFLTMWLPEMCKKPKKSEKVIPIKSGPKSFFPSKDAASVRKLKFQYLVGGGTKNIYRSGWFFSAFQPVLRAKSGKMYPTFGGGALSKLHTFPTLAILILLWNPL